MFANGHYDSDDGGPSAISNVGVEMGKPKPFGVVHRDKRDDLLVSLQETKGKNADEDNEFTFWKADYKIRRSKDYTFGVGLTPYW